jgi:hypothetical protein
MIRRLTAALASYICPHCGWWAAPGHQCHPADR